MPKAGEKRVFDELSQIDEDLDIGSHQSRASDDTPDYLKLCRKTAKTKGPAKPSVSVESERSATSNATRPQHLAPTCSAADSEKDGGPLKRELPHPKPDNDSLTSAVHRGNTDDGRYPAETTLHDPRRSKALLQRTSSSEPTVKASGQEASVVQRIETSFRETTFPAQFSHKAAALSSRTPAQSAGSVKAPSKVKKGKKKDELDMASEERQLFKGKTFFFFPPGSGSGPRRLRVKRSLEYGANLAEEWGDDITHIMVDSSLVYSDLIKWLGVRKIPEGVLIVDADYPSSCLHFQRFLDPKQSRFLVKGCPEREAQNAPRTPVKPKSAADLSLYAGKTPEVETPRNPASAETARTISTPFDSNERSELDVVEGTRTSQTLSSAAKTENGDALDEAIEETKRFEHLVSK